MNIFGFIHFSRDLPDGKDVNRSFPGIRRGSLASRIAYNYTAAVLPQVDMAIDLQTGGGQRHNFPQVRYTSDDIESENLARSFAAPFYFPGYLINGSFRKTIFNEGNPTLVYEAGESMRFDENAIDFGIHGIKNVLLNLGILFGRKRASKAIHFEKTKWVRASMAGMFLPKIANGSKVMKGTVLGMISDIHAKTTTGKGAV